MDRTPEPGADPATDDDAMRANLPYAFLTGLVLGLSGGLLLPQQTTVAAVVLVVGIVMLVRQSVAYAG